MDNHHIIWAGSAIDDIDNINYQTDYQKEHNIEYTNDNIYGATIPNNINRTSQYPSWNYYSELHPNTTEHS